MGVYIKGMEMPNTCQICRAARLDRLIDCEEFDRLSIAQRMYKRSETCPLVLIPPHGRLIDADKLEDRCSRQAREGWHKSTNTTNWGYAYAIFKSDVEDAPTILPTESLKDDEEQAKEESEQIYKAYDSKAVKTGIKAFPEPPESEDK